MEKRSDAESFSEGTSDLNGNPIAQLDDAQRKKLFRKIDLKVLPIVAISYLIQ